MSLDLEKKCGCLNTDERAVVEMQVDRMLAGKTVYGNLNVDTDARDFELEMLQEILDGMHYTCMRILQLMRRKKATVQ